MLGPSSREPFGRYLKRRRVDLGLTQEQVADGGNLSQTYVSELEKSASSSNPRTPTKKMIPKIAAGLGVSISEVEDAAGYQKGVVVRDSILTASGAFVPPAGMRPARLSTGDIIFLSPTDPDPDNTVRAIEAWMSGYRAGKQSGN